MSASHLIPSKRMTLFLSSCFSTFLSKPLGRSHDQSGPGTKSYQRTEDGKPQNSWTARGLHERMTENPSTRREDGAPNPMGTIALEPRTLPRSRRMVQPTPRGQQLLIRHPSGLASGVCTFTWLSVYILLSRLCLKL